jgi:Bax protein
LKKLLFIFTFSFLFAGLPDYYYKLPIQKQKEEFKRILIPMIEKENQKILQERYLANSIFNKPFYMLDFNNLIVLSKLAKKYKIYNIYNKEEFLKKIDVIPPRLVLAQGAVESAWGRSYFAREANNLFGQWDYSGRGLVPKNRDANKTHTVRIFKSPQESLAVYMRNLNRNPAYKKFREVRYRYRKEHKKFTAEIAATTLILYSQLREVYVKILQNIMKQFK